jgi:RNA polymerase sigma-70 factor (ECF subfamily)
MYTTTISAQRQTGSSETVVRQALSDLWASQNIGKLRGFARSLTHNPADAEELLQEACARVLAKPQLYDASRPFDTWVGRVLLNAFRDRNKSFAWTRVMSLDFENPEDEPVFPEVLSDGQPSHLDELLADESRQHVAAALRQLPQAHQEILTLCDIEALSYEDAARKLGVPLGTVRSRRARACAALFQLLQEN